MLYFGYIGIPLPPWPTLLFGGSDYFSSYKIKKQHKKLEVEVAKQRMSFLKSFICSSSTTYTYTCTFSTFMMIKQNMLELSETKSRFWKLRHFFATTRIDPRRYIRDPQPAKNRLPVKTSHAHWPNRFKKVIKLPENYRKIAGNLHRRFDLALFCC